MTKPSEILEMLLLERTISVGAARPSYESYTKLKKALNRQFIHRDKLEQLKEDILLEVYRVLKPQEKHIKKCKCKSCKIKDFVEFEFKGLTR